MSAEIFLFSKIWELTVFISHLRLWTKIATWL